VTRFRATDTPSAELPVYCLVTAPRRADTVQVTNHLSINRRRLLTGSAAAGAVLAGGVVVPTAFAESSTDRPESRPGRFKGKPGTSGVTLRWLGNNAWEITFANKTILVDPWLTRFPTGTYGPNGSRPDTLFYTDPTIVDRYINRADLILVCHGHFDHMADVPYIATKTGAGVLGTETHVNLMQKMGAPAAQLGVVSGGEYIQYEGFTVEVFTSLHSLTGIDLTENKQMPFPGTRPGPLKDVEEPRTIGDLVEGGTLAYQITIGEKFRILSLSTANFIERELVGLRPDLVFVAAGGRSLHDYVGRLMRVLDHPTWVVPTHWDDFDLPLDQPAKDFGALPTLRSAVVAASPTTTFVQLDHLQTFTP
jgi:L-ascorbate metabolism protein UlaG (beta-lactamase superfamily)